MLSEKEMKKRVKDEASSDPDRFFPTEKMREIGLKVKVPQLRDLFLDRRS